MKFVWKINNIDNLQQVSKSTKQIANTIPTDLESAISLKYSDLLNILKSKNIQEKRVDRKTDTGYQIYVRRARPLCLEICDY